MRASVDRPGSGPTDPREHFEFRSSLFLPEVFLQEVDADGLFVVVREDAAAVALDHARLAHRAVPHDHHLRMACQSQLH